MTNVASLDLCKELYTLSQWETDEWFLDNIHVGKHARKAPKYDLGYLLDKLELAGEVDLYSSAGRWICLIDEGDDSKSADTHANAACKLAIELLNQGVLK
jgi:hypothetical protein